jgi:hypothetical protein
MLIPKNQFMFGIGDNGRSLPGLSVNKEPTEWFIQAYGFERVQPMEFKTMHTSLEDAEKELRGLKIYLRQNHSHVDTDANYTKIV